MPYCGENDHGYEQLMFYLIYDEINDDDGDENRRLNYFFFNLDIPEGEIATHTITLDSYLAWY